jgi:hypothetical protein
VEARLFYKIKVGMTGWQSGSGASHFTKSTGRISATSRFQEKQQLGKGVSYRSEKGQESPGITSSIAKKKKTASNSHLRRLPTIA